LKPKGVGNRTSTQKPIPSTITNMNAEGSVPQTDLNRET